MGDSEGVSYRLHIMPRPDNIQILCQQFSIILINMDRLPVRMIVFGSKDIVSNEGTTQGDNFAMSFFFFFLSGFSFTNIHDSRDSRGRGRVSV